MIFNIWKPYQQNHYSKEICFIRLSDGKEYGPCWPNAGTFHILSTPGLSPIPQENVEEIKYVDAPLSEILGE